MGSILIIVFGVIEAAIAIGVMFGFVVKRRSEVTGSLKTLEVQVQTFEETHAKFRNAFGQMVGIPEVREKVREFISVQESLKVERGRITITQAELETVEGRLRELEEIERELEASAIETKEELKILERKHKELKGKNDGLKEQIEESLSQMEQLMSEIELTAQMQEQVQAMQAELLRTQTQIDTLLLQIEQGNEQYFVMKKRYDALDIEYAQLYEKFAEIEDMNG